MTGVRRFWFGAGEGVAGPPFPQARGRAEAPGPPFTNSPQNFKRMYHDVLIHGKNSTSMYHDVLNDRKIKIPQKISQGMYYDVSTRIKYHPLKYIKERPCTGKYS